LARNLTEEDQRRKTSENRKRDAQHSNHQEELPCYAMVSSFWRLLYWFVPVLFPMMRWLAAGEAAGGEADSTQGVLVVADFTPQASAVVPFTLDVCTVDADIVLQEVLGRFIPLLVARVIPVVQSRVTQEEDIPGAAQRGALLQ
jgi:hypothetical protein